MNDFCIDSLIEGERRAIARIRRELTAELSKLGRRATRMGAPEAATTMYRDELQAFMRTQAALTRGVL